MNNNEKKVHLMLRVITRLWQMATEKRTNNNDKRFCIYIRSTHVTLAVMVASFDGNGGNDGSGGGATSLIDGVS